MAKGFKKDGRFIPTDKTISGVKKRILEKNPDVAKVDNSDLMKEKATPEVSKAKVSSLSDGDLKKSIDKVNSIFSGQTNYLQKNNNEFDERVTKENHEKTLDALNMLIEEKEGRTLLKETKKKRKDYSLDDDDEEEKDSRSTASMSDVRYWYSKLDEGDRQELGIYTPNDSSFSDLDSGDQEIIVDGYKKTHTGFN